MKATLLQLATYIERDGATVRHDDRDQIVTSLGGQVSWRVPADQVDALNAARDVAYAKVAARRRKLAQR